MKTRKTFFIFLAVFTFLNSSAVFAESDRSIETVLGSIPVQHGGRIKPFESFARENVLVITGKASFEKISPVVLIWRWIGRPDDWGSKLLLPVENPELQKIFSNDLTNRRIAPNLVLADRNFLLKVQSVQAKQEKKETLSEFEKKELQLYNRARLFEEISRGRMPGFIPHPDNPRASWLPLEGISGAEGKEILKNFFSESAVEKVQNSLLILKTRVNEDLKLAATSADFFKISLNELMQSRDIVLDELPFKLELFYLHAKPFHIAWLLYLAGIIFWVIPDKKNRWPWTALSFYAAGFLMHTSGFALRCLIAGRPPVTNMYESVIWVSWAVILFSLILFYFYRSAWIPVIASSVTVFALLIGESLPTVLDQSITPLVPVLRNNFWLTIHVLTITLGYGAFLLNWGIAHVLLFHLAFVPSRKNEARHLTEFLYRTLQIGIILLAAGTILGGVWASYSWGRFWGWDPKETWALIALLAYLAVLHGRTAGWLDSFQVAFYSAFCFLCVLMAWYGVNFVLATGLHSYGFGGGGLPYVLTIVAFDAALLCFFYNRFKIKQNRVKI